MIVQIFDATDLPDCTNYALKSAGRDNRTEFSLASIETILKSFYADDLLKSVVTKQEAITLVNEMIEAIKRGGFRLAKLLSNDEDVVKCASESERNESVQDAFFLENTNERTLDWNLHKDAFTFSQIKVESSHTQKRIS